MAAAPYQYAAWFKEITGHEPHPWQRRLGEDPRFRHRLIRIPTGMGKTAGATLAWLFHRVIRNDPSWPRRLVYTLPAHTLVEPTEAAVHGWLAHPGLNHVALHVLSAAVHAQPWALMPDTMAVLLGTQDMVLSRALGRGHGTPRAMWPAELALLHHDALWVLDEVHLHDTGLTTSVQLAAFREQDRNRAPWFRPAQCWWMSATMEPERLRTVDASPLIEPLSRRMTGVPSHERQGGAWQVQKRAERRADVCEPGELAALALQCHEPGTLTLCMVNRIEPGLIAFRELHRLAHARSGPQARPRIHMVHDQFRGAERRAWFEEFLRPGAELPAGGRIVVCTGVLEASTDVSARVVITELAPWANLVQRAGRAGRFEGDSAQVIVTGAVPENERDALPYDLPSLAAADKVWQRLAQSFGDASMRALLHVEERVRERDPALGAALHGPEPEHIVQRRDMDELFDTTADLGGADLDVSCFIHGHRGHVWVAWRDLDDDMPGPQRLEREVIGAVSSDELCPVPLHEARAWVQHMEQGYVLDYVEGAWMRVEASRLVPGMVMVVPASVGGYDRILGWDATAATSTRRATMPVEVVADHEAETPASSRAGREAGNLAGGLAGFWDSALTHDDDSGSIGARRAISRHGGDTARVVAALCDHLNIGAPHKDELMLAARWHDAGKAHPAFQYAIATDLRTHAPGSLPGEQGQGQGGEQGQGSDQGQGGEQGQGGDQSQGQGGEQGQGGDTRDEPLARVPARAWLGRMSRPGFRHELASALALFELLRRASPEHEALLAGRDRELMAHAGMAPAKVAPSERVSSDDPLAAELVALPAASFDRVVYLVASHHGKVRCAWDSSPADERVAQHEHDAVDTRIHGVMEGDELAGLVIEDRTGTPRPVPRLALHLDAAALGLGPRYGASWVERVARLRTRLGPFALALLETVLRAADARASLPELAPASSASPATPASPASSRGDDDEVRS